MPELVWNGKYDPDGARHRPCLPVSVLRTVELGGLLSGDVPGALAVSANRLIMGETQRVLPALLPDFAGRINLIYIDPPFATGLEFTSKVTLPDSPQRITRIAYRDSWDDLDSYLRWLDETLALARDLLADDGALLLHCDWRAEGVLRLLLDDVFGADNFRNAIVWSYRSGGASRRESLARKHDTILLYARSPRFSIRPQTERQYLRKPFMGSRRDAQGRHYVDTLLRDVLEGEITCVGPDETLLRYNVRPVLNLARERLDYPTQKPLGLLRLLLTLASDPGDLILDCCCGSGATALAAETLDRRWIAADASPLAIQTARKQLLALPSPRPFVVQRPILEGSLPVARDGGRLNVAIEQSGCMVTARLASYSPPPDSLLVALPDEGADDTTRGLRCLDSWSVDWAYDGAIFRHAAHAARPRTGSRALPAALSHTYAAPGCYAIAIHTVDFAGTETTRVIEVDVVTST
ncbi:MAG TPA: site-specific DNA-methyltransferase [Ktedonobacterales bacterium]|nr:site-specific DNA-methyltransferase [Ktedonobacterales bacterium]